MLVHWHAVPVVCAVARPSAGKTHRHSRRWGRREIADTAVTQATLRISYQQSVPGYAMQLLLGHAAAGSRSRIPRDLSLVVDSLPAAPLVPGRVTAPHRTPPKVNRCPALPSQSLACTPRPPYRDLVLVVRVRSLLLLLLTTIQQSRLPGQTGLRCVSYGSIHHHHPPRAPPTQAPRLFLYIRLGLDWT